MINKNKYENGRLVAQTKLAIHCSISNIEAWTGAFISYSQILLEKHPQKANELFAYMAIIRSAASEFRIGAATFAFMNGIT